MKTIKEIQEENRKFIILAIRPDAKLINGLFFEPERADGSEYCDQIIIPPTLDRVLIALGKINNILCGGYAITDSGYLVTIVHADYETYVDNVSYLDLTKPTLEEQTEETQRAINKLLKNK